MELLVVLFILLLFVITFLVISYHSIKILLNYVQLLFFFPIKFWLFLPFRYFYFLKILKLDEATKSLFVSHQKIYNKISFWQILFHGKPLLLFFEKSDPELKYLLFPLVNDMKNEPKKIIRKKIESKFNELLYYFPLILWPYLFVHHKRYSFLSDFPPEVLDNFKKTVHELSFAKKLDFYFNFEPLSIIIQCADPELTYYLFPNVNSHRFQLMVLQKIRDNPELYLEISKKKTNHDFNTQDFVLFLMKPDSYKKWVENSELYKNGIHILQSENKHEIILELFQKASLNDQIAFLQAMLVFPSNIYIPTLASKVLYYNVFYDALVYLLHSFPETTKVNESFCLACYRRPVNKHILNVNDKIEWQECPVCGLNHSISTNYKSVVGVFVPIENPNEICIYQNGKITACECDILRIKKGLELNYDWIINEFINIFKNHFPYKKCTFEIDEGILIHENTKRLIDNLCKNS